MRISVFGEIAVDHILYSNDSKESFKWFIDRQEHVFGGAGANVAATYKVLDCDVCFFTGISQNYQNLYQRLEEAGIKIIPIARGDLSEIYDLFFPNEVRRTVAVYPGEVLKIPEPIPYQVEIEADILHVTPISLEVARQIPIQSQAKLKLLSPAAEYMGINSDQFSDLIQRYDMLCLDLSEALGYTGLASLEEVLNWFKGIHHLCTVITQGDNETIAIQDGFVWSSLPAGLDLATGDLMGCGDTFAAAIAYHYFLSKDITYSLEEASHYAAGMASIKGMWVDLLDNNQWFQSVLKSRKDQIR